MDLNRDIKRLFVLLGIAAAVFFLLNINYFLTNIRYFISSALLRSVKENQNEAEILPPDSLFIESLEIKAPIQYVDRVDESQFQKALQDGVVHYPGTALPGQYGNVYIFGHSSDYIWSRGHYKAVFATLPKIKTGAKIVVTDGQGEPYTYVVTGSLVASATDLHYLEQDLTKKTLTLQTSYPVGTAQKRYIVLAEISK